MHTFSEAIAQKIHDLLVLGNKQWKPCVSIFILLWNVHVFNVNRHAPAGKKVKSSPRDAEVHAERAVDTRLAAVQDMKVVPVMRLTAAQELK